MTARPTLVGKLGGERKDKRRPFAPSRGTGILPVILGQDAQVTEPLSFSLKCQASKRPRIGQLLKDCQAGEMGCNNAKRSTHVQGMLV